MAGHVYVGCLLGGSGRHIVKLTVHVHHQDGHDDDGSLYLLTQKLKHVGKVWNDGSF